ncbi:hypothetical protein FE391_42130 [Nonomuraea sp. KC401]|nr:oligopeptide/dipeptide ABC transporter ATP-binding protein [Nonomuraea sp. K271]NBE99269.1 hypothetical protein [Nonomuraea sp. K271]TLF54219.1 hypothetical protein FE391_42130 [Nonomuraea sp. KC401]
MYLGKVVETGSEQEVYGSAAHPYTQALLSAAPVPDPALRGTRREIPLEGEPPSPVDWPRGCSFHPRCWKAEDGCSVSAPALEPVHGPGHLVACHLAERPAGTGTA